MKKYLNYIKLFVFTAVILFLAIVVSSKIPHCAIEENIKKSAEFYKQKPGIYKIKDGKRYSYIHYFADVRKLNIIFCLDSDNPIESVLWSKYYQKIKADTNVDFIDLVENSKEPNTEYLRYWNGCMLFLRPMLMIMDMEQIYLVNKVLLAVLILVLFIVLLKKNIKLAFIFLLALTLVSVWYATFCIEYSVTFYIMIFTSMMAIKIDSNQNNKKQEIINEKLSKIFLITGIVTTFFDFLTTELLTLFVPLIFLLIIRKEENRLYSLKDTIIFIAKMCSLWFCGYVGMWFTKWILASLILHINSVEYIKDNIFLRINGLQGLSSYEKLYKQAISRNIFAIPLMDLIHTNICKWQVKIVIAAGVVLIIMLIDWKKLKSKKYLLIFCFIGIIPYIRYLVLANHSYRHVMFTFRSQIITIMCILYIIIDCLNYKLLLKKLT